MHINYTDLVFHAFLFFGGRFFIILFLIILFLTYKREIAGRTLFLLLFSSIVNVFLKSLWQVPLPQELGEGFAFPSGHMQAAVIMWGWLALEFRNRWFSAWIVFIFCGIALGLVHFGYHHSFDIIGALASGGILIILYAYLLHFPLVYKNEKLIGLFLAILAIPLLWLMPKLTEPAVSAEAALIGLSIGWYYQPLYPALTFFKQKAALVNFCLLGVGLTRLVFLILSKVKPDLIGEIPGVFISNLFIGFWVGMGAIYFFYRFKLAKIKVRGDVAVNHL